MDAAEKPTASQMTVSLKADGLSETVEVASFEEASRKVTEWQDAHGFGASALLPGHGVITVDGKAVARVAYNGRVFYP